MSESKNSPEHWNECWKDPKQVEWRAQNLSAIYDRISQLMPKGLFVTDLGGGVGVLGQKLQAERNCRVTVWEHNDTAVSSAIARGLEAKKVNLESEITNDRPEDWLFEPLEGIVVSTEVLEHLSLEARLKIYTMASKTLGLIASVPHDRLGPEVEPEHTVQFTAVSFLNELRSIFGEDARVECIGGFLLGVAGPIAHKNYKLSVCFPARDEDEDIGETLASFRAIADEIIIGIDPRTIDNTIKVVEKYAEKWFYLEDPEGPPEDRVPTGGVHFAWIRNQCVQKCSGDWIFMTEAHESLSKGVDTLLNLDKVLPVAAKVVYVWRTTKDDRWPGTWLFKNSSDLRFIRSTHNMLNIPASALCVRVGEIETFHKRVHARALERKEQRAKQNRHTLLKDWIIASDEVSLLYLGSELRDFSHQKAIDRFNEFLAISNNGPARYHVRLMLAKQLALVEKVDEARRVLYQATADDWGRIEHWIWLGDIARTTESWEEAIQFYSYATTRIGNPPFTLWWIDLSSYSYLAPMRLVECFTELGKYEEALFWARRVEELFPLSGPEESFEEIRSNIAILEEVLKEKG